MRETVFLQNLKSNRFSATILKKSQSIKGITNINLDIKNSKLTFDYATHNAYEGLRALLNSLGYTFNKLQ
jgi:hypothetical protein